MKIVFKKDTGEVYLTSPEMELNDDQYELLDGYALNTMSDHFIETEPGTKEFILWVESKPKDFQKLISELRSSTFIPLPDASEWT